MTGFGRKQAVRIAPRGAEKRSSRRSPANVPATLDTPGSRERVTILDFSPGGACLDGPSPPASGRLARLRVNGIVMFGAVVWRKAAAFGLRFDETLNADEVNALRGAAQEAEEQKGTQDRDLVLQPLSNGWRERG